MTPATAPPRLQPRIGLGMVLTLCLMAGVALAMVVLARGLDDGSGAERTSRPLHVEGDIPEWDAAPGEVPACPQDLSPRLWASHGDGSYLVCAGADEIRLRYRDEVRPDWVPNGIEFDEDYATIKFSNGSAATLLYDSGFVTHLGAEDSATSVASSFWVAGRDLITYDNPPTSMSACPGASFPLFFVAWWDGWQLTCGVTASQPTLFAFSDGRFGADDSAAVTVTPGQYCADFDDVVACTSTVDEQTSFDSDGELTLRDTTSSFFPRDE